jgi:hypothetical protein
MIRQSGGTMLLLSLCLGWPGAAPGETTLLHGADSIFTNDDVTIVWGMLRAPGGASAQVVIRIVAAPRFKAVSVDAVDPFAGTQRAVAATRPLAGPIDVRRPSADFAEFPRLEIHLYSRIGDGVPAVTVYYLGVPDTTPEFTVEPLLLRYLSDAVATARPSAVIPPR